MYYYQANMYSTHSLKKADSSPPTSKGEFSAYFLNSCFKDLVHLPF